MELRDLIRECYFVDWKDEDECIETLEPKFIAWAVEKVAKGKTVTPYNENDMTIKTHNACRDETIKNLRGE